MPLKVWELLITLGSFNSNSFYMVPKQAIVIYQKSEKFISNITFVANR